MRCCASDMLISRLLQLLININFYSLLKGEALVVTILSLKDLVGDNFLGK